MRHDDNITAGTLPEEYEELRETVADFARTVVAPVAAKHDAEHTFPYEVVARMGDMGLFGLPFPEEYGGMGGDYFALAWRSRNSARSTRAWRSRWRPGWAWARCRSTGSATRRRSRSGCRT